MKWVVDTNVWVSALATRGLCADLVRTAMRRHGNRIELMICPAIRDETLRVLREKFAATDERLVAAEVALDWPESVFSPAWQPPAGFPDPDDVPIVSAALSAGAVLVTGDRVLLELEIPGLEIITPRVAYQRLLEPE